MDCPIQRVQGSNRAIGGVIHGQSRQTVQAGVLVADMLENTAGLQDSQIAASFNNIRDVTREVTFEETVKTLIMSRLTTGWQIAAIFDPTPISDILETIYFGATGNWKEAGISFGFAVVGTIGTIAGGQATNAVRAGRLANSLDAANDLRRLGRAGDTIGDVRSLYKAADPVDNVASSMRGASIGHCPTPGNCFGYTVGTWGPDDALWVADARSQDWSWLTTMMCTGIGIAGMVAIDRRSKRKQEEEEAERDALFAQLFGDDYGDADKASGGRKPPGGSSRGVGFQRAIATTANSRGGQAISLEASSRAAILEATSDPLDDSDGWLADRLGRSSSPSSVSLPSMLDTGLTKRHRKSLEAQSMPSATIQSSRTSVRLAKPKRRRSRLGIAWLLVFLGLAGLSAAGVFNHFLPNGEPKAIATRPVTAPDITGPYKILPIGARKVGERSYGRNPDRTQVDETILDVDPPTWRELRLRMVKASGKLLWIDMLRPLEWLEECEAHVGGAVWLELPEFGAVGEAEVLFVGPCPEIKPGRGNVITATFKHESDGNLFDLRLTGQAEATIVTGNHTYWSLDRKTFVEVAHLRNGERLNTAFGETTVVSATRIPEDAFVYNMEVHREHVYRVGSLGTLVHNSYLSDNLLKEGRYGDAGTDAHHLIARAHPDAADARAVLRNYNINIDDAMNGVWLPRNSSVSGARGALHNEAGSALTSQWYIEEVNRRIVAANAGGRAAVLRAMQKIRYDLLNGTFPGVRPNF